MSCECCHLKLEIFGYNILANAKMQCRGIFAFMALLTTLLNLHTAKLNVHGKALWTFNTVCEVCAIFFALHLHLFSNMNAAATKGCTSFWVYIISTFFQAMTTFFQARPLSSKRSVRAEPGVSASCLLLLVHVRGTAMPVPLSGQRGAVTGPGEDITFQVARPHSAGRPSD